VKLYAVIRFTNVKLMNIRYNESTPSLLPFAQPSAASLLCLLYCIHVRYFWEF